ncbi:MAG: hypothetical protein U0930_13400 [Pirellulales bacterium]
MTWVNTLMEWITRHVGSLLPYELKADFRAVFKAFLCRQGKINSAARPHPQRLALLEADQLGTIIDDFL